MEHILDIRNLHIQFDSDGSTARAVNGVNLTIERGETLGLVGETGAGKTTTALGILNLIPHPPGKITEGEIFFQGEDLLKKPVRELQSIRGNQISMIFQDPMTALNPVLTVCEQIAEVIKLHQKCSHAKAEEGAARMMELVGIPAERMREYPHQFSGGMKQRIVIAIALACNPQLLIADEPTTALDVTIQAQVLKLMKNLQRQFATSLLLITHDLGVVAEVCDKVAIMYAGEIIECGTAEHIFEHTAHPYTKGLFASIPSLDEDVERLQPIPGMMPDPAELPPGCKFCDRCPLAEERCKTVHPEMIELENGHTVRCLLAGKERANG